MKLRFAFCGFLFLSLVSAAMASATWYVDGVHGSNSNSCQSATTACKTITHAISLAASGDTIKVAAATYAENITIPFGLSIYGAGAATTILDGGRIATVVTVPVLGRADPVVLSGLTIRNGFGSLAGDGGGISNGGVLYVVDCIITGNNAGLTSNAGGGISSAGMMTINKTTISGNTANSGAGIYCGGVFNGQGFLRIYNSTISDNTAGFTGGGIYGEVCRLTITNDTISGNVANGAIASEVAGGVLNAGTLAINNSTISGNSATVGANNAGGIWSEPNAPTVTVTIQNSIVANNKGGNCIGSIISDGYNLSSDDSCSFNSTGDLNTTDPKLGPLQNNGGPTDTMALLSMSPAIDAGNPNGCTDGKGNLLRSDQRGFRRPGDPKLTTGCDIGAYEAQLPK